MSLREVAAMFDLGESTVRRRTGAQQTFRAVPGSRPLRLTAESVEAERSRRLALLGVDASSLHRAQDQLAAALQELEQLRTAIQSLLVADSAHVDVIRGLTQPALPEQLV